MRREAIAILNSGGLVRLHEFGGNQCLFDIRGCEFTDDVPVFGDHREEELLGHVTDVWIENFMVKAALRFTTSEGRRAFEELPSGISMGVNYAAGDVDVIDDDGAVRSFDLQEWRNFRHCPTDVLHVRSWELVEVSLTDRPLDRGAIAKPVDREARRIRRRMRWRADASASLSAIRNGSTHCEDDDDGDDDERSDDGAELTLAEFLRARAEADTPARARAIEDFNEKRARVDRLVYYE
jgi:hypothetical protein